MAKTPGKEVESILTSLYGADVDLAAIPNQYHYEEYHYKSPQKTPLVGTNQTLEVRVFNENSYNGPRTEDFVRRAHSLYEAALYLLPESNVIKKEKLKELLQKAIEAIEEEAAIDFHEMMKETGRAYFEKKYETALNLLQQLVSSLCLMLQKTPQELLDAESQVVTHKGRSNLIHIYNVSGHTRI